MKGLSVGKLARAAGVNVETVRYYERIGILPKPERRESGYRIYGEEDVHRLRFIKHAQQLGFSLKEIKELLELRVQPKSNCEEVRRQTEQKLKNVRQKIEDLQRIERALGELITACQHRQTTDECPILAALEEEEA